MNNVVHVINAMEIGGVEVGVLSLLKSPERKNYKVVVTNGCDSRIYDSLTNDERDRLYICNGIFVALCQVLKLKPDVIISSLWRAHLVSLMAKIFYRPTKRIHFVHSSMFAHNIDKFITKLSLRNACHVFFDSVQSKKWVSSYFSVRQSSVIPMNVTFSSTVKSTDFMPINFVYVGRFSKEKNLSYAIDFIGELQKIEVNATLDLYGRDDGQLEKLEKYILTKNLSDCISFHNPVLPFEIESVMRKYNYYLQTSLSEGMSISVYQAIKNGLLPVISPVGEIPNYTNNNENAIYLDTNDLNGSVQNFYQLLDTKDIENLKVGLIKNESDYPKFDCNFFSTLNSMNLT